MNPGTSHAQKIVEENRQTNCLGGRRHFSASHRSRRGIRGLWVAKDGSMTRLCSLGIIISKDYEMSQNYHFNLRILMTC